MAQNKASRILDAAAALLLDFGFRKVTVDEVAARANVGKGTVYLYWPSKLELFAAVLTRATVGGLVEQAAAVRADPAEALLHRAERLAFLQSMRRPLVRAFSAGNYDLLGELARTTKTGLGFATSKAETSEKYLKLLYRNGLLADDPEADPLLSYRLSATVTGFYLFEGLQGAAESELAAKADALATTVRRAFEPARKPQRTAVAAAADGMVDLYQHWVGELAATLPDGTLDTMEDAPWRS